jgi:hypothetical protein
MSRIITYAVEEETGLVYSRVGAEIAVPVLQYERIGKGGDFTGPLEYELEKFGVHELCGAWNTLRWTKKIPVALKNRHREFWGMAALKVML